MKQIPRIISKATWALGLLLLLTMILAPSPLQANGFGEQEVRAAVETWVRYVTADARPDAVVERMEPYQVNGETVAYIAHLKDGGFCITGADALLLPVYFYSPHGTYDAENPALQYILWEIGARLEYIRQELAAKGPTVQQYQDELSERAAYWQDLIAGRVPARMESRAASADPVMVKLDLTSQWSQGPPYNDQTPTLPAGSGNHTRVGCVATAMAQIMYYWQWPQTGVDNVSVTYNWRSTPNWITTTLAIDPNIDPARFAGRLQWTPVGGGQLQMNGDWDNSVLTAAKKITNTLTYQNALQTLWNGLTPSSTNHSANLGFATYNWGILQDTHGPPPDPGDVEVAELSYHAGLAAKMQYGIWESGAIRQDMVEALENNFRFDQDATLGTRDIDIMTEEIQWLRPIGFAGRDSPTTGHVWVISGYNKGTDPHREFWMNLGWGGINNSNGWFSYDGVPENFNDDQEHITRIAPLNVVRFVGASDSGDGTPDNPYQHIEEAITAAPSGATLIFKAGSDNTFSASTLTINRPFTLKGKGITIRKE